MYDPPDEDYLAAHKVSADRKKVQKQDGVLEVAHNDGAYSMNIESDQKNLCSQESSTHVADGCNDIEEDLVKKGKFKAAKDGFKKINFIVKSKIDDIKFGRGPVLRGKKKNDKQDKGIKRLSLVKDSKEDVPTELRRSTSQLDNSLTTEGGITVSDSVVGDAAKEDATSSVQVMHGNKLDFNTDFNKPVTSNSSHIWTQTSFPSEAGSSLCEFTPLPPQQSNDLIDFSTDATPVEQSHGYAVSDILSDLESTPLSQEELAPHDYSAESQDSYNSSEDILSFSGTSSSKWADTIKSTTSSIASSVNRGCREGVGPAVPVDFMHPVQNLATDDANIPEYSRLYFHSIKKAASESHKELPEKQEVCDNRASVQSEITEEEFDDPYCSDIESFAETDEDFWGSEFDESSYQDDLLEPGHSDIGEAPDKPLPPKPEKKAFFLRSKSNNSSDVSFSDEPSSNCLPVTINPEKHPAPELPPQPSGLSQKQIKRRMVIESIVGSERSYLESLERLVRDYEKTVLEFISQPKSHVRLVFRKMKEIIFHHKMFQIELAECVKVWDKEEKIGDIFTGSFSKTMLISSYSVYVNNFAVAMDEIRSLQRSRQSFQDFLQKQEKVSCDRLSIFGLMVKPVQRFPQFIMFLQDLIKFTPQNHSDRMALQLALTELENVAYRLNERKRQSEQKFQARQFVQQLIKQKVQHVFDVRSLVMDPKRRLIRNDSIVQVHGEVDNTKSKGRQLILMNDHVLCVKVLQKEQSGYTVERYALRWMAKLKDLELKDTTDLKSINEQEQGNINISQLPEGTDGDPFHLLADLRKMFHDHIIIKQITSLVSMLQRSYAGHGLKDELIHEILNDLEQMIQIKEEQLRLVSSCSIVLQDTSRLDKPHYMLQTQTAALKQDWCVDFLIAKLALEKSNNLGWDGTSGSDGSDFDVIPSYFIKHIPVDVPKNYTKIKCAVPIYLNPKKSNHGLMLQHLWVCSSTPECGLVSILSIHNSRPSLIESFRACGSDIMAVELVPGCGTATKAKDLMFAEDTVWMAASQGEILIFPLSSEDRVHRLPLASVKTVFLSTSMKFLNNQIFCGTTTGDMVIYSHEEDGGWNVSHPTTLNFGSSAVKLHFVHRESIWLSCGNRLCQLEINSLQTQAISVLNSNEESHIDQVAKSGVGIWVSFKDNSVIKLFHLETMENLQEISVGNFVSRIRTEKSWTISKTSDNLSVTCLAVSRGLLWIGTSIGVILTVPLPRLSDGVPLYRGSPKLSLHAHKGPVRFILLLQCSSSVLEMNKPGPEIRQSQLNLDSNQLELEKIQTGNKMTVTGTSRNLMDEDIIEASADLIQILPVSSASVNVNVAAQEKADSLSDISDVNIPVCNVSVNIPCSNRQSFTDNNDRIMAMDDSVQLRNKSRSSEVDRRSKTLSFFNEQSHQNLGKSKKFSRSYFDLTVVEPCEVQVLYKSLLEEEPDISHFRDVYKAGQPGVKRSIRDSVRALSTPFSRLSFYETTPLDLIVAPVVEVQQGSDREHHSETLKVGDQSHVPPGQNSTLPPSFNASSITNYQGNSGSIFPYIEQTTTLVKSFVESKTAGLMSARKASSNAIVVVSGGDGYIDLDMSRKEVKMDDACVLLWIHKFY